MHRLVAFLKGAPFLLVDIGAAEGRSSSHWPGQGRISTWFRRLTETVELRGDSVWINSIGAD